LLEEFLNAKPLFYDEIDCTRMPRIYESIKEKLQLPKIIHLIGTNGKGTTGRFLASAFYAQGFNTGHYTSPHIMNFNERIWLNAKNVSDDLLNAAHEKLLLLLRKEDAEALSYFEYTTLLAMLIYEECDYVVLEAGLGGEYDATAVFENILTVVTPIGFDHEAFLGSNIQAIAQTKLNAAKQKILLGRQLHKEVYEIAQNIADEKGLTLRSYTELLNEEDHKKSALIAKNNHLADYLQENLKLSIAALHILGLAYKVEDFDNAKLFGRLSQLSENILLDVGHNTLAAEAIAKALEGKKYRLIYNSYKDKNYVDILRILFPIISEVELIEVKEERIEDAKKIEKAIEELGLAYKQFDTIEADEKYLVFGSFSVAEAFLKKYTHG